MCYLKRVNILYDSALVIAYSWQLAWYMTGCRRLSWELSVQQWCRTRPSRQRMWLLPVDKFDSETWERLVRFLYTPWERWEMKHDLREFYIKKNKNLGMLKPKFIQKPSANEPPSQQNKSSVFIYIFWMCGI